MAYNEVSFQLKVMLSSEFPCTKFTLLINHPRKPCKVCTVKMSGYTLFVFGVIHQKFTIIMNLSLS